MSQNPNPNPNPQRNSPDDSELHRLARLHDLARLRAEQLRHEAMAEWSGRCFAVVLRMIQRLAFWR